MGGFEYPQVVGRLLYVTEVGGRSESLERDEIGLHSGAIASNTELSPRDGVLLDRIDRRRNRGKTRSRPLFVRNVRRLEPITDFHDSRLLAMGSDGEAILSSEDPMDVNEGEEIILNAAVNLLPWDWLDRIIRDHVRGGSFSLDRN